MISIKNFIISFLKRDGSHVFIATVISRLLSFLASYAAIKLIPNKNLGAVIFAFQIILFLMPISSAGLNQSLIRFGSRLSSTAQKNELFIYSLKKGLLVCLISIVLISIGSFTIDFELQQTNYFLILLSFSIIPHYIFELIKIQFRLKKENKIFATSEASFSLLNIFFVIVLSYYFQETGYAISIILVPLLVSIYYFFQLNISLKSLKKITKVTTNYWSYGVFASLSNVTTQLLISIDILLIGYLLKNLESVTAFKYVTIIPYSLLFLSQVILITDFVDFTENINKRKFILNYIKNYIVLFSIISITCILFIVLFGKQLLSFFDESYIVYHNSLITLTIGVTGILILRALFGNLLSSIGKASSNFYITGLAIFLNLALNFELIPKLGLFGASLTSAILMWFTGILAMILFFYYYSKRKEIYQ